MSDDLPDEKWVNKVHGELKKVMASRSPISDVSHGAASPGLGWARRADPDSGLPGLISYTAAHCVDHREHHIQPADDHQWDTRLPPADPAFTETYRESNPKPKKGEPVQRSV